MRIAVLTSEVPNAEYSSSTYVALLLAEELRALDHEVELVLPLAREGAADDRTRMRWLDALSGRFGLHVLDGDVPRPAPGRASRLRRLVHPSLDEIFPERALAPRLAPTLQALAPDALLLLSYEAVAATDGLDVGPRFAFLGEPPHTPLVYRRRPPFVQKPPPFPRRMLEDMEMKAIARATIELLSRCERVALNAAHHAEWVREEGVPQCAYMRYPAADWSGARADRGGRPFRIVLLGRVTGSSTLPGLHLFADEVLPRLEQSLGDGFEVHVCGGGRPPAALGAQLDRPSIRMRGYVDDAAAEVRAADVFLVPTPLELGARVRIPFAWSTGVAVVSHSANALGLPELSDGENVLLGANGAKLASAVTRLHRDPELRARVGAGGRQAWEALFAPPVAAAAVDQELRTLAAGRNPARIGALHPADA